MADKPRDYEKEYKQQKARPEEHGRRMKRQKARRALDAEGVSREGKHVAHTKALANGGSNAKSNIKLVSPGKNLSFSRKSNHKPVR